MSHPQMFRLRQHFEAPRVEDPAAETVAQLSQLQLRETIKPGQSVAITAGSRGIASIDLILRAIVQHIKHLGATPFLVPAMGSHGGGTAEGQRKVLASYNITEEFTGCEIRASMDTIVVCQAGEGFPVHFDRHASTADHVLVCGRVKPHTNFVGDIESGLMKMMLIGLGKHAGAKVYHRAIMDYSFNQILRSVAREVLKKCNIVAGLAIIENGYDQTAKLEAVHPQNFETREPELLAIARSLMPRLPFVKGDILLLDEIGKNISGSGMDTNVVGRKRGDHSPGGVSPDGQPMPEIKRIVVRDLSNQTHGNAAGIGIAEFCRSRVIEKMDVEATRINCLTGGHPTGAMLPLDYVTDRDILAAALPTIGLPDPPDARLMWIRNTLDVAEVECSAAYRSEAETRDDLEILTPLRDLPLGEDGNLPNRLEPLS